MLFKASSFFWYIQRFHKGFNFWNGENLKPKYQPLDALKLYAYKNSLVAKLGDPIECLKHNGHSLAQAYSMVGIKVSFVDVVDML